MDLGSWDNNQIALNKQMDIEGKIEDLYWWVMNPEQYNGRRKKANAKMEETFSPPPAPPSSLLGEEGPE